MSTVSKLFQPITVGTSKLSHRVVLAPLTRFRANAAQVPSPLAPEYYAQRGSQAGTLLITEATFIAAKAGGYGNVPGIWSDDQIAAWKKVTDAVHAKGSFIYLQLWALGRTAKPDALAAEDPSFDVTSASDIPVNADSPVPRPLSTAEVEEYVQLYATAAANAVHKAGFDGVELHGANGYLIEQFLEDISNVRTDKYGGSIENRSRFALEAIDAVAKAIGQERTAIRFSPWGKVQGNGLDDPKPQYTHVVSQIREQHPSLAYIHVVSPRVDGYTDRTGIPEGQSNEFIRQIWAPRPLISAGGYTPENGPQVADETGDLIAYGRLYISNPDLPYRIQNKIPADKGDRALYYIPGSTDPKGYTSWPFAEGNPAAKAEYGYSQGSTETRL